MFLGLPCVGRLSVGGLARASDVAGARCPPFDPVHRPWPPSSIRYRASRFFLSSHPPARANVSSATQSDHCPPTNRTHRRMYSVRVFLVAQKKKLKIKQLQALPYTSQSLTEKMAKYEKNRSTRRSTPRHPIAMASTAKPPDPMPCALAAILLPESPAPACHMRKTLFPGTFWVHAGCGCVRAVPA